MTMEPKLFERSTTEQGAIKLGTWIVIRCKKDNVNDNVFGEPTCTTYVSYTDYAEQVSSGLQEHTGNCAELYYFVALWASNNGEFPVLGSDEIPEARLLDPFRRSGDEADGRPDICVFFLVIDFKNTCEETLSKMGDCRDEGIKMLPDLRGVTLFKIELHSPPESESLIDAIQELRESPLTASEMCSKLQSNRFLENNVVPISSLKVGLPRGRSCEDIIGRQLTGRTEEFSDDFALLIDLFTEDSDKSREDQRKIFESICCYLRIKYERRLLIVRQNDWTPETAESLVEKRCEEIKEKLRGGEKVGKFWVFLTAHGDRQGVETHNDKTCQLDDLLKSLFVDLHDRQKIIFVDACRGGRDNPGQQLNDESSACSRGLIFQNCQQGSSGQDGCFIDSSRNFYFAIFASLPGYTTYEYDGCGHLLSSAESALKKLRGKAVTTEELAEVIQHELENWPDRGVLIFQEPAAGTSIEASTKEPDLPNLPDIEVTASEQAGEDSPANHPDPIDDSLSTRQIQTETKVPIIIKEINRGGGEDGDSEDGLITLAKPEPSSTDSSENSA